jgi:tetratricopeptide (TPR) repeat protein
MLAAAAAWGQPSNSKTIPVRGEIVSPVPLTSGWTVQLGGPEVSTSESVGINPDNTFEFRAVTPGTHELRVVSPNGKLWHQEYVSVNPYQQLSIRLSEAPQADRSSQSTISLQQLQHKIPPRAQKAYQKGEDAASKGNYEQARTLFQQAVALDPEYVDAYNELGATEARLNRLPEAAAEFQKAIDVDPDHRQALPNLSIVLAKMRRYHEAGEVARRALKVVPESGKIHYILAVSLITDNGDFDETILHLERAASEVHSAHLTAAELLAERGRSQEAIHHLEEYLHETPPDDSQRSKAETLLTQLRP